MKLLDRFFDVMVYISGVCCIISVALLLISILGFAIYLLINTVYDAYLILTT